MREAASGSSAGFIRTYPRVFQVGDGFTGPGEALLVTRGPSRTNLTVGRDRLGGLAVADLVEGEAILQLTSTSASLNPFQYQML